MTIYILFYSLLGVILIVLLRTQSYLFKSSDLNWRLCQHMLETGIAIGCIVALLYITSYLQYVQSQAQEQQNAIDSSASDEVAQIESAGNILILPTKIVKL
jgi:hypothetical protein